MPKLALATLALAALAVPTFAQAACTPDDVMSKSSSVSEVLMEKVTSKPDPSSKLMSELGEITSVSPPTAQTCTRLDALLVKAKAL